MAHKTLIGGTAYEIDGGKALVDATAYEIDKGKTLVGGTTYEVGFYVPVIINFVVESTACTAEEGMTWGEWIESNYNTVGIRLDPYGSQTVCTPSTVFPITTEKINGIRQYADYLIVADTEYVRESMQLSPPPM